MESRDRDGKKIVVVIETVETERVIDIDALKASCIEVCRRIKDLNEERDILTSDVKAMEAQIAEIESLLK